MVNYTFGDGYKKITDFEIKPSSGDICISGNLDFERRNSYEFPIIATDRGEWLTVAHISIYGCCPFMWSTSDRSNERMIANANEFEPSEWAKNVKCEMCRANVIF